GAGVTSNPWLVMTFSASPTTVNLNGTSTLTAAITKNSNNQTGFSVPDGTPVTFSGGSVGSVNPSSTTTTSGLASSTLTATSSTLTATGPSGNVSAKIDNQTQTVAITVNSVSTDLTVTKSGPSTVTAGTTITYTVTLTNAGPSDAQAVQMTDAVPTGTTFVSA